MFRKSISLSVFIAMLILVATIAVPARAMESPNFSPGKETPVPTVYRAPLDGAQEVPSVDTDGKGFAMFFLKKGNGKLGFTLHVANLEDIFASHIHCAPAGQNGPVGVTLFGGSTVSIEKGLLSRGTITAPNEGNACGWETVADVLAAFDSGGAYVNVHTNANPAGEIRGQVR